MSCDKGRLLLQGVPHSSILKCAPFDEGRVLFPDVTCDSSCGPYGSDGSLPSLFLTLLAVASIVVVLVVGFPLFYGGR